MKKIICIYGGPGIGKTTTMAGVFYELKMAGLNGEMNPEYIKNWVWEDRPIKPGDQSYFFAKMSRKERIGMEKNLNFIVTDSPLILTHFYGLKYDKFEQLSNTSLNMLKNHHEICKNYGYTVDHYVLTRKKEYNPAGRFQDEDTAKRYDKEIEQMLIDKNIKYTKIEAEDGRDRAVVQQIVSNYIKE